jgi:hypothetical protein
MSSMVYVKVQIEAGGLKFEDCVWKVRGALAAVEGVHEIMVDTDCRHAVVGVCPDKVSTPSLISALRAAGFGTRSQSMIAPAGSHLPEIQQLTIQPS